MSKRGRVARREPNRAGACHEHAQVDGLSPTTPGRAARDFVNVSVGSTKDDGVGVVSSVNDRITGNDDPRYLRRDFSALPSIPAVNAGFAGPGNSAGCNVLSALASTATRGA